MGGHLVSEMNKAGCHRCRAGNLVGYVSRMSGSVGLGSMSFFSINFFS